MRMRPGRTLPKWFPLLTGLGLLLAPTAANSQFEGPPGGFGGRGGIGGGLMDPSKGWEMLTGGASVWRRAEITNPNQQRAFDFMAQMVGATNGVITKEQFLGMSQRFTAMRAGDAAPRSPVGLGQPTTGATPALPVSGSQPRTWPGNRPSPVTAGRRPSSSVTEFS